MTTNKTFIKKIKELAPKQLTIWTQEITNYKPM